MPDEWAWNPAVQLSPHRPEAALLLLAAQVGRAKIHYQRCRRMRIPHLQLVGAPEPPVQAPDYDPRGEWPSHA